MKRSRVVTSGKSKKRKMTKRTGLMGKINKKIQKAITKVTEVKLRPHYSSLTINSFTGASNKTLPASQILKLTGQDFWPPIGTTTGATQITRIGNSLKKVITYFQHHFELYANKGTGTTNNLNQVRLRVIVFTVPYEFSGNADILEFFQYNTNTFDPIWNPTNKAKVTVIHDYIIDRGQNNNMGFGQITTSQTIKTIDRKTTRRFKEVLFDSATDVTPKRPYRDTFIACFGANTDNGTSTVAKLHNISRCYWTD